MPTIDFNDRYQEVSPASSTDPITLDFPIANGDDLTVQVNGTETLDFTVSATFDDGVAEDAVVTIITPDVASPTVEIVGTRNPARTMFTVSSGHDLVSKINAEIAQRVIEIQELARDRDLSLRVPYGDTISIIPSVQDRAGKFLGFTSSGDVMVAGDAPSVQYQGAFTTANAPTTRLDGSPLEEGDLYFDTDDNRLMVWNGSSWVTAVDTGGGVADGDKGDITVSGSGSVYTIDENAVTLAKMADLATNRILGRTTAGTGDPEALTELQVRSMLGIFGDAVKGLVPASGGGTTKFLRADQTFAEPANSGFSRATAIATTSGTEHDFSIPAGVSEIVLLLDNVSTDGIDDFLSQLGDAGGVEVAGYDSSLRAAGGSDATTSTAGFIMHVAASADTYVGVMRLYRIEGNKWIEDHQIFDAGSSDMWNGVGIKETSAEVTTLRLTTTGGDDVFDNGKANVLYR